MGREIQRPTPDQDSWQGLNNLAGRGREPEDEADPPRMELIMQSRSRVLLIAYAVAAVLALGIYASASPRDEGPVADSQEGGRLTRIEGMVSSLSGSTLEVAGVMG